MTRQQAPFDPDKVFHVWLDRSPRETQFLQLAPLPDGTLQCGGWPRWFLHALWKWAGSLSWGHQEHVQRRDRGITYFELLASFVVCSHCCPPVSGSEGGPMLDPLDAEGVLQPIIMRTASANLVQGIRFLERRCRQCLWPAKANAHVRSLSPLHDLHGRKGLSRRPALPQAQRTSELVLRLWESNCGETLRETAWKLRRG